MYPVLKGFSVVLKGFSVVCRGQSVDNPIPRTVPLPSTKGSKLAERSQVNLKAVFAKSLNQIAKRVKDWIT